MSPYLKFENGNSDSPRGRALLYIRSETQSKKGQKIIIDGASLKEAIHQEFLVGRLISINVFEAFYVTTTPINDLSIEQFTQLAKKEMCDLVPVYLSCLERETLADAGMEQAIARYINLYSENICLRLLEQLEREIFHKHKRSQCRSFYVAFFKLAGLFRRMLTARRKDDNIDFEYYSEMTLALQKELPMINIHKIINVLQMDNWAQWQEITTCIDACYLTLKKHFPLSLSCDLRLSVEKNSREWLSEELPSLYEEYLLAIFQEQYEKAQQLKDSIDSYHASQSLNGCC